MSYSSQLLTPERTPIRPQVVEASTPWSDVIFEDGQIAIELDPWIPTTYGVVTGRNCRTRFRGQSRIVWLAILVVVSLLWAVKGGKDKISIKSKLNAHQSLDGLQFINSSDPAIRYVGRWVLTADRTHKDGSFPGVYFDFALKGSKTVLLSLHNKDQLNQPSNRQSINYPPRLAFLPLTNVSDAAPISLLAKVDDEDYIVLPNASSTTTIRLGNLDPNSRHDIRIIAPMVSRDSLETLQFEGIWIDEGANLVPFDTDTSSDDKLSLVDQNTYASSIKHRMLEIVTDLPGSKTANGKRKNSGITHAVLDGVMGWEYLLGEMFGSDHVTIGMEGMCLIQDCIGGVGSPVGLADVFFQSGPAGSEQFVHPWLFQEYVPDVMVMNIGNSDWNSFQAHIQEYNKTLSEFSVSFEETYIAMIKAIRTLAYPRYSTTTIDSGRYVYSPPNAGAGIPIFIMRPFRGQLEQATQAVVNRLRMEGDKSLFWLDTSGWLNTEVHFDGRQEDQDFFLDEESSPKQWRLTERGNQRVAILLHMHVCRYLAQEVDRCAFLPPETYHGKAIDHEALRFDEYLEAEREMKLKKLFWD